MTDAQLLAAAARVVERRGPIAFTLADAATEAGVSAPTFIHRFGSKRGLLLALSLASGAKVEDVFARAATSRGSRIAALHAALAELASPMTPRAIASGLAFLQLDVTDKELRRAALAWFAAFRDGVQKLLEAAIDARELTRTDTEALARAVEVAYNGGTLSWAIRQDGPGEDALRHDVDAVLAPFKR